MNQAAYQHELPQTADRENISAESLAVHLRHPNEDSATELMSFVHSKTAETCILRLCGTVRCKNEHGEIEDMEDLRNTDVDNYLARLGEGELMTNPWFEVINAEGDALTQPFDHISRNPNTELNILEAIIATRNR